MERVIKSAIDKGFNEIAFTDHIDFTYRGRPVKWPKGFEEYFDSINKFKIKYENKIKLLIGAEIGPIWQISDDVNEFLDKYDFEFVILSAHMIGDYDLYQDEFYEDKTKYKSYMIYFQEVLKQLERIDKFSVFGHLDLVRRYYHYRDKNFSYAEFAPILDEILTLIIKKDRGIEINTSGYFYGVGECHPSHEILRRYKELGGEILTIGSDAHKRDAVGRDFEPALAAAKEAGFKYLTRFENKKPVPVLID
jgi:histidinol-phosphatase (PHP family)